MAYWRKMISALLISLSLLLVGSGNADPVTQVQGLEYGQNKNATISWAGKPAVVVFLSAKCPCSASHAPHLGQLAKDFPLFHFVGVHSNQNEKPDVAARYFSGVNLPFPVVRDPGAKIADQFGALKTPHVFVLNDKGEKVYMGPVTDSSEFGEAKTFYLKEVLMAVTTGGKIPEVQRRPLGCYIVR
ncbi:MAG: redoxin domain-containing protein [Bdellovibrionales bacterium]|nr:redoxin domain-containing protein [Bdellovibrionales bacterium]